MLMVIIVADLVKVKTCFSLTEDLISTEHSKGKILALFQELRQENKSGIENPSMSEVIGRCGGDEKTE